MMILSPAIVLKEKPAAPDWKFARDVLIGALLVFAGLGMLSVAAARRDRWE